MRVLLVVAAAATLLGFALADRAGACSCAYQEPRERLKTADAAVIGTIVADGDPARLRVTEKIKGDVADEIELPNEKGTGSSCEPGYEQGEELAVFLDRREGGGWSAGTCDRADPGELRRAAQPLPAPLGRGTAALIAVGEFAGNSAVVLDAEARVLAYGTGDGWHGADVCPGGTHLVGVARRGSAHQRLVVRRLTDLEVVRRPRLPRDEIGAIDCRDPEGRTVVALAGEYDEPVTRGSRLLVVDGGRTRTLRRADIADATFIGNTAYLNEGRWGRDLVAFNLRTGRHREVARVPNAPAVWHRTPDRRHLATTAYGPELTEPVLTVVVEQRSGRVRWRPGGGSVLWLGNDRLLNNAGSLDVLDARLRRVRGGRRSVQPEGEPVRVGERIYALSFGELFEIDARRASARRLATLPSRELRRLIALPGDVAIDVAGAPAPPRGARERRVIRAAVDCGELLL